MLLICMPGRLTSRLVGWLTPTSPLPAEVRGAQSCDAMATESFTLSFQAVLHRRIQVSLRRGWFLCLLLRDVLSMQWGYWGITGRPWMIAGDSNRRYYYGSVLSSFAFSVSLLPSLEEYLWLDCVVSLKGRVYLLSFQVSFFLLIEKMGFR